MPQRTEFKSMECPIARSLGSVGERWSFLILRDAFQGMTKFDEFRKSIPIATNVLARQLKMLTESGMLETRHYSDHANRVDYVLTEKGRDFFPVIAAMMAWSNKHLPSKKGPSLEMADRGSGKVFHPRVVNGHGETVSVDNVLVVPGPAASRMMHKRLRSSVKALRYS
jgi:DNA-binding HxlR family transcriptional regulator